MRCEFNCADNVPPSCLTPYYIVINSKVELRSWLVLNLWASEERVLFLICKGETLHGVMATPSIA